MKLFPKNIHPVDRGFRVVLGTVLAALAFTSNGSPWFLLGLIPLLTGLAGTCPAYTLLGTGTAAKDRQHGRTARVY